MEREPGPPTGVDRRRWDVAHTAGDAPTLRAIRAATVWAGLPSGVEPTTIWPTWPLDRIVSELELSPGQVLLDLACGRGDLGVAVAERCGVELVGVEPSPEARRVARRKASDHRVRASIRDGHFLATGLRSQSIDAVLIADSLQLAPDRVLALRAVRRVIRDGRRVVIIGPERPAVNRDEDYEDAGFVLEVKESTPGWQVVVADLARRLRSSEQALRDELGRDVADGLLATPFDDIIAAAWHGIVALRAMPEQRA